MGMRPGQRIMSMVLPACIFFLSGLAGAASVRIAGLENLAPKAKISAESEYSTRYLAKFVADGVVPVRGGNGDPGKAWCVKGDTHRDGAALVFEWAEPVTVGAIVYYGRTAWFDNECWKDYVVLVDDDPAPLIKGRLEMADGPQPINFGKTVELKKLTIRFTSSYGGPNPGASEIEVFSVGVNEKKLKAHLRSIKLKSTPWAIEVDCEKLRGLIEAQSARYGDKYPQAGGHLARLEELVGRADEAQVELKQLQREVLLFDIDRLVVIKRHEISATHVYTYHYEGFKAGGGLYVVSPGDGGAEPVELVSSPTGQILDCDLSYDGRTILFSRRQKEDEGYHLWTINVDGTGLTQLTRGPWHDYNGCWLPDGGIGFLSSRIAQ
ncbi:MAG: hypothetical protein DRP66_11625, partial [Planctomycetota bacterium]